MNAFAGDLFPVLLVHLSQFSNDLAITLFQSITVVRQAGSKRLVQLCPLFSLYPIRCLNLQQEREDHIVVGRVIVVHLTPSCSLVSLGGQLRNTAGEILMAHVRLRRRGIRLQFVQDRQQFLRHAVFRHERRSLSFAHLPLLVNIALLPADERTLVDIWMHFHIAVV